MKRLVLPLLLAVGISTACAQNATVTTSDEKGAVQSTVEVQTAAEKSADSFCLRETGTHLKALKKQRNEHAVECAGLPGRVYTREDIERTGSINTADALRRLDPSIH